MERPDFRPCEPADLPVLQAIRAAAFAPVFAGFRAAVGPCVAAVAFRTLESDQAALLDRLCAPGSDHAVLVAALGGSPLGFAAFRVDPSRGFGEIGLNAVHPDHAGRGLGTRLYTEVLARMKEGGARVVEVGTGGDAAHAPARRAYEKAGFRLSIPSVALYREI